MSALTVLHRRDGRAAVAVSVGVAGGPPTQERSSGRVEPPTYHQPPEQSTPTLDETTRYTVRVRRAVATGGGATRTSFGLLRPKRGTCSSTLTASFAATWM